LAPAGITPQGGVFPLLMKKNTFHLLGLPRWRSVFPGGGSPKKTKAFCGAKVLFSFPFRMQASLRGGK